MLTARLIPHPFIRQMLDQRKILILMNRRHRRGERPSWEKRKLAGAAQGWESRGISSCAIATHGLAEQSAMGGRGPLGTWR